MTAASITAFPSRRGHLGSAQSLYSVHPSRAVTPKCLQFKACVKLPLPRYYKEWRPGMQILAGKFTNWGIVECLHGYRDARSDASPAVCQNGVIF